MFYTPAPAYSLDQSCLFSEKFCDLDQERAVTNNGLMKAVKLSCTVNIFV